LEKNVKVKQTIQPLAHCPVHLANQNSTARQGILERRLSIAFPSFAGEEGNLHSAGCEYFTACIICRKLSLHWIWQAHNPVAAAVTNVGF